MIQQSNRLPFFGQENRSLAIRPRPRNVFRNSEGRNEVIRAIFNNRRQVKARLETLRSTGLGPRKCSFPVVLFGPLLNDCEDVRLGDSVQLTLVTLPTASACQFPSTLNADSAFDGVPLGLVLDQVNRHRSHVVGTKGVGVYLNKKVIAVGVRKHHSQLLDQFAYALGLKAAHHKADTASAFIKCLAEQASQDTLRHPSGDEDLYVEIDGGTCGFALWRDLVLVVFTKASNPRSDSSLLG